MRTMWKSHQARATKRYSHSRHQCQDHIGLSGRHNRKQHMFPGGLQKRSVCSQQHSLHMMIPGTLEDIHTLPLCVPSPDQCCKPWHSPERCLSAWNMEVNVIICIYCISCTAYLFLATVRQHLNIWIIGFSC